MLLLNFGLTGVSDFLVNCRIAWAIRNKMLFSETPFHAELVRDGFRRLVKDYKAEIERYNPPAPVNPSAIGQSHWNPPTTGYSKLNTDAGLHTNRTVLQGLDLDLLYGIPTVCCFEVHCRFY